jgi:Fe2+ transport system protein FeoA
MTPRAKSTVLIPLTEARPGQRVRVSKVDCGRKLRIQLCAMGLMPGARVEVVSVSGGPVILSVMGGRLMLGQGMAAKVLVREA